MTNQVEQQTVRDVASYWASLLAFSQRYLRVPGIQAAVYRDSEIVLSGAYGCADVEAGAALTEEHLFRIASQSKTDTAIAILQLAERGKLRWTMQRRPTCRSWPVPRPVKRSCGTC